MKQRMSILSVLVLCLCLAAPVLAGQTEGHDKMPPMGKMSGMGGKKGGPPMSGMSGHKMGMDMMDKMMSGMSAADKKQMKPMMPQMKTMMDQMPPAEGKKMMDKMMAMPPAERKKAMEKMMQDHHGAGAMKPAAKDKAKPGVKPASPKSKGQTPVDKKPMSGDM